MCHDFWNFNNIFFAIGFLGNFRELIEYLNGTADLLAKNGNILDNVLETLDVQQHSLGVLYVLVAKFTNLSVSFAVLGIVCISQLIFYQRIQS